MSSDSQEPSPRGQDAAAAREPRGSKPERPELRPQVRADGPATTPVERRLRALLDGMLDPVVTIDDHGTILEVSRSVERVFGYAPEELLGKNVKVLTLEPYRSEHDSYLANYRRTGETNILGSTREFEVRRKDGEVLTCELSVSRVDVPEVERPLFIGSFRDVSDRRRAEQALRESDRRVRAIFDQEVQFVGLLDLEGRVLEVNQAALDSVGVTREEVLGRPLWECPWVGEDPDDRRGLRQAVERTARGRFVRQETEYVDREGQRIPLDFSLKPIRDEEGRVVMLLPEGRDISFLKAAQRRETAMLRALAEIGESASILAHEIKNPITAINLALTAVADELGEDHRVVLEDLAARMRRLEQTMRRTLSFTAPPKVDASPVDLERLLGETAREAGPRLEAAGIVCEVEVDPGVPDLRADPALLEELLTNLVANAVEALVGGGHLTLRALPDGADGTDGADGADGKGVLLEVEDDGPGIPERLLPDLFKPFVSMKAGGTGLGLALCRRAVEAHGGSIEVDSGPMEGARFRIRLPATPE